MINYVRLVKELMAHGMKEDKAFHLVANAYAIEVRILQMIFHRDVEQNKSMP